MGWSFAYDKRHGKKETIAELRDPSRFGEESKLLQACTVGNHHWTLIKTGGITWIGLDLLQSGGKTGGWGYKSMDEASGPYYYDCPVSYLDKASPPRGYAGEWRAKVRELHAEKEAKKAAIVPGGTILYGRIDYKLIRPAPSRKGWVVQHPNGVQLRMTAHQLARATITTPVEKAEGVTA